MTTTILSSTVPIPAARGHRVPAGRSAAARAPGPFVGAVRVGASSSDAGSACCRSTKSPSRAFAAGPRSGVRALAGTRAPVIWSAAEAEEDEEPFEVDLMVTGMMCENCVESVEKALTGAAGVVGVDVDLETGLTCVKVDVQTMSEAFNMLPSLVKAVEESGFEAQPQIGI